MTGFRLSTGGARIDRSKPLTFHYNGQALQGFEGDTLASALMASGRMVIGRSFKYHRPRGIIDSGIAETNALMQVGEGALLTPNVLATDIPLYAGLAARSVNCWPSPEFDLMALNGLLKPFLTAGFYYKTFMWPSWHLFEPFIRHAAGLGKAPSTSDTEYYDVRHLHVDTLIVGAGAGGQATLPSAKGRVLLVDREPVVPIEGTQTLGRTTVIAHLDHNMVLAVERLSGAPSAGRVAERLWKIRAGKVIYATGYQEQPLVFANNDRPGVMLASAVESYITQYGVAPGKRILIAASTDVGLALAKTCQQAGLDVVAVIDSRESGQAPTMGGEVIRAIGRKYVQAAEIETSAGRQTIACDIIAMSAGFSPALQLFLQAGGTMKRGSTGGLEPDRPVKNVSFISNHRATAISAIPATVLNDPKLAAISFVDFQTDVTLADISQAVQENYAAPDHLKRYTVLGMGIDQGKISGANGAQALAHYRGISLDTVLPTKSRLPLMPTKLGVLAAGRPLGELWRPRRHMPAHDLHVKLGAVFEDFGWERPAYYRQGQETLREATTREVLAVRNHAGLFDGSPLAKFELKGPQAGAFLDHIYIGTVSNLAIGHVRYGLMFNENGTVIDDGVCMRMADDHFLVNATSGNADRIFMMLQDYHHREWHYDLAMQNVTAAWGTLALAGPKARAILMAVGTNIDVTPEAFPHLHMRTGTVAGIRARVARVSFSGEVTYEISVAAQRTTELAEALLAAGKPHGLTPYGIEALEILRTEKGYIHIGTDTDSETQPSDIGFGNAITKKQADFIGRRSLLRANALKDNRRQLIGLKHDNARQVLPIGAHIIDSGNRSIGFIGSSYLSPALGHGVAMAMLENGRALLNKNVRIYSEGKYWTATVTKPVFYDPAGKRLNG
jgi:sarcosine oxidase, subunit alpha